MPFGKYKHKDLRNIPHAYLDWVLTLPGVSPDLKDGIRQLLGYTQVKYPSIEAKLRPTKGEKKQGKLKSNMSPQEFLDRPENAADYAIAMTGNVQEMAAACERIRQRRELW
jgi:hypothetical protein